MDKNRAELLRYYDLLSAKEQKELTNVAKRMLTKQIADMMADLTPENRCLAEGFIRALKGG